MNRQPVTGRRLRQIVENTGYKYGAAFETRSSPLVLAVKIPPPHGLSLPGQDCDWVNVETWEVWPAVRLGRVLRNELPITRDPATN